MDIFNVITLLGGLAMFLYGMRMMGDGLKASSSGTLKKAMEKVTGTPVKAFFLGLLMTAVIQSSTATIVITSGLVGGGDYIFEAVAGCCYRGQCRYDSYRADNQAPGSEFIRRLHTTVL